MPELPENSLAFDTETRGLRWHREDQRAFLGTWADEYDAYVAPFLGKGGGVGSACYLSALHSADALVAHNLKFDAHQTRATLGDDLFETFKGELHDTDLMSRVLAPEGQRKDRGGHGLKNLARVFLRDDADRHEKVLYGLVKQALGRRTLKSDGAYYDVWRAFPAELERYALFDARYTYDLAKLFLPRFDDEPRLWDLYNMERGVQRVLYTAERRGVRVDPQAVTRLHQDHERKLQDAEQACKDALGFVPEGEGNEERLVDALLGAGVELSELTPTGELATNKGALMRFEDHPAVASLFRYRHIRKFLQTYIEPMLGTDTVHPDFQQAAAWTSRMSCRNPNMQNLPKRSDADSPEDLRMRSMFVPREDHYFVIADYNAIEPRLLAWYLGVPEYRKVVAEGRTYERAAAAVWGGKPEDYAKDGPKAVLRDVAKIVYLAIIYGAGGPAIRTQINRNAPSEYHVDPGWVKDPDNKYDTPPEAAAIKRKITADIPGWDALAGPRGRVRSKIKRDGYVRTMLGRKQIVDPEKDYVGLNALLQGGAAEIMKKGAINLAQTEGTPLLFVHDEALVEFPKDYDPQRAVAEVKEAMESAFEMDPPLVVEATVTDKSYAAG